MSEGDVSGPGRIESWMRRLASRSRRSRGLCCGRHARAQDDADIAGDMQDAIVGAWVGQAAQPENDPFEVRLTFVSPKGGVSRYPGDPPCGGMLVGDRKGDAYEYQESITYGGTDEKTDGCLNGTMNLTVEGDTMKYQWTAQLQRPGLFLDRRAQTTGDAQEALARRSLQRPTAVVAEPRRTSTSGRAPASPALPSARTSRRARLSAPRR